MSLRLYVPIPGCRPPPTIEVCVERQGHRSLHGHDGGVERSWTLPSRGDKANELRLVTSATVMPALRGKSSDTRELGLRLDRLSWMPVQ